MARLNPYMTTLLVFEAPPDTWNERVCENLRKLLREAGAAGGFLGLVEAVRQLAGAAGERGVPGACHALVSGFGMINYDRGICTAAAVLAA